jgi:hypothetical protein
MRLLMTLLVALIASTSAQAQNQKATGYVGPSADTGTPGYYVDDGGPGGKAFPKGPAVAAPMLPGPANVWYVLIAPYQKDNQPACMATIISADERSNYSAEAKQTTYGPFNSRLDADAALKRSGWIFNARFYHANSGC